MLNQVAPANPKPELTPIDQLVCLESPI
jgi:hypothetical protein